MPASVLDLLLTLVGPAPDMEHSIPAELWATPLPLVAVVGLLDRPYPPAHAAKWQKVRRAHQPSRASLPRRILTSSIAARCRAVICSWTNCSGPC